VIRADRRHVHTGRGTGPARGWARTLVVALALLAGAAVGPVAHSWTATPERSAQLAVNAGLDARLDARTPSTVVVPRATGHPARTPAWPGPAPAEPTAQLLLSALLALLLLVLVGQAAPLRLSAHALPLRRGPPFALLR
jgi:hypothetical protein